MRRNPLLAPGVDAFLPFGSRRDCQKTFLVVVLHLGSLPGHAELAADFAETLFHRVVPLAGSGTGLFAMNGKKPVWAQMPFAWKAAWRFILVQSSFKNSDALLQRSFIDRVGLILAVLSTKIKRLLIRS